MLKRRYYSGFILLLTLLFPLSVGADSRTQPEPPVYSPRLLWATPEVITLVGEENIWLYTPALELLHTFPFEARIWAVAWSHDGGRLAVSTDDNSLLIFDAATYETLLTLEAESPVSHLGWSADDTRLLVSAENSVALKVHDSQTGEEINSFALDFPLSGLATNPVDARVALVYLNEMGASSLLIMDGETGETLAEFPYPLFNDFGIVTRGYWSPDGEQLAIMSGIDFYVWQQDSEPQYAPIPLDDFVWLADSSGFVSAGYGNPYSPGEQIDTPNILQLLDGEMNLLGEFDNGEHDIVDAAFAPDRTQLVITDGFSLRVLTPNGELVAEVEF